MNDSIYLSIQNSPALQGAGEKRERFAWILSAIMLGLYSGFILLIAYGPQVLGAETQPRFFDYLGYTDWRRADCLGLCPDRHLRTTRQRRIRRPEQCDSQGGSAMIRRLMAVFEHSQPSHPLSWAAEALTGEVHKQPLNVPAILMFVAFVGATLCITYWASKRNKSAADYYAAGGKITGFQNGLAIAGDYMSRGVLPGYFRAGVHLRLRRPDLLDRLPGGLADHSVPDRRAPA